MVAVEPAAAAAAVKVVAWGKGWGRAAAGTAAVVTATAVGKAARVVVQAPGSKGMGHACPQGHAAAKIARSSASGSWQA